MQLLVFLCGESGGKLTRPTIRLISILSKTVLKSPVKIAEKIPVMKKQSVEKTRLRGIYARPRIPVSAVW